MLTPRTPSPPILHPPLCRLAEYLGYSGGSPKACASTATKLATTGDGTWSISSDEFGNVLISTAGRGCAGGESRLTAPTTTASDRPDSYLSKAGSRWVLEPMDGKNCDIVNVIAKVSDMFVLGGESGQRGGRGRGRQ